jgi:hypothetical protein
MRVAAHESDRTRLGHAAVPWNDKDRRCGTFCQFSIWSTPKNPENHARQIIRLIDGCIRKRGH